MDAHEKKKKENKLQNGGHSRAQPTCGTAEALSGGALEHYVDGAREKDARDSSILFTHECDLSLAASALPLPGSACHSVDVLNGANQGVLYSLLMIVSRIFN